MLAQLANNIKSVSQFEIPYLSNKIVGRLKKSINCKKFIKMSARK